MQFDKTHNDNS